MNKGKKQPLGPVPAHTRDLGPRYGAVLGALAFVFFGAVPGLLYGGYAGLMMSHSLLGVGAEASLLGRVITGGGMALGFIAALFLFLVVGASIGAGIEAVARRAARSREAAERRRWGDSH